MWRILIGLGCVPACVALYFRLTIPETPRFTMDIERNVNQAAQDVDNFLTSGTYYVDPDTTIERVQALIREHVTGGEHARSRRSGVRSA